MDDDFDLNVRLQNIIPNAFARLLQTRCPGRALLNPREASERGGALGDVGYFEYGGFIKEFNIYDPSDRYVHLPRRADSWLVNQDYGGVMPLKSSRSSKIAFEFNASVAVMPLQEAPVHVQPKITLQDDEFASIYAYAPVMRDLMLRQEIKEVKKWLVRNRHIVEPENTCVLTSRVRASGWISVYQAAHERSMSLLAGLRSVLGGAQGNVSRTVDEDKSAMTRGPQNWTAAGAEANYTVIAGYTRALSRFHYKRLLARRKVTAGDSATGESNNQPQVSPGTLPPVAGVQSAVLTPMSPAAQPPAAEAPAVSLALYADAGEEQYEEEDDEEDEDSGDILMRFLEAVLERREDIDVVVADTGLILDFAEAYNVAPVKTAVTIVVEVRREMSATGSTMETVALIDELIPASDPTVLETPVDSVETKGLPSIAALGIRQPVADESSRNAQYANLLGAKFTRSAQVIQSKIDTHQSDLTETSTLAVQTSGLPSIPDVGEPKDPIMNALTRYESSQKLRDLDEILKHWRLVLSRADSERGIISALLAIAVCLFERRRLTEDAADLDALIDTMGRLVELIPDSQSSLSLYVGMLALALLQRYELKRNADDLDRSVASFRRARALVPDARVYIEGLVTALRTRVRDFERRSDIDELITLASHPLEYEETPDFISLQGHYSFRRFRGSGEADDIDRSLAGSQMASAAGDDMGPVAGLGYALEQRFLRYGDLSDLDLAIRLITSVLESKPLSLHDVPALQRLAACCVQRFLLMARSSDIDAAIALLLRAIELDPQKLHRQLHLHLAHCYMQRFYRGTGEVDDIDHAIEMLQNLKDSGDDVGTTPEWYMTYGECLIARCSRINDPAAMHEMLTVFDEAAACVGGEDRTMAKGDILRGLALARLIALAYDMREVPLHLLQSRIHSALEALGHAADAALDGSQELYLLQQFTTLYDRLIFTLVEQAKDFIDFAWVRALHSRLFNLISEEIWLGDMSSRSYEPASRLQSAISTAVATAFLCEEKDTALVWLEQGRAIAWSQIQDLERSLELLREYHPDIAERMEKISSELKDARRRAPLPSLGSSDILAFAQAATIEEQTVAERRIARQHKLLLEHIRSLQGFQSFLRPKSAETLLLAAPGSRAVACINVHDRRCDALVIFGSELHQVRLPQLTPTKVGEWYARLTKYVQRAREPSREINDPRKSKTVPRPEPKDEILDVLREMWVCVVWPILEVYLGDLKEGRAHITWCTTGQLAFLPLHAAGPYDGESPNAFDLVVSSYTPNLSSLLPSTTATEAPPSILVVAQPNTPGAGPLPGTAVECQKVAMNFSSDSAQVLLAQDGTTQAVLEHMAKHPYVHLACHGKQDADPLQSGFLLYDGPLTLHMLMAHKSSNAQLAFLSGCEAATSDETVLNDSVHLAAGMLAAGYKSVVATMWGVSDDDAPLVAYEFYKALCADPERNIAFALHDAVQKLREHVRVDQFVKWIPYFHLGL